MRLLVLGGTKFLGRSAVEAALAAGHEVTLFNRGETNAELFPETEKLRGDRTQDLSLLEGREWDAVLDTAGYFPAVVRASAEALAGATSYYLFVSSVSAYADQGRRNDEDSPLAELGDEPDDRLTEDFSNYGALKALCEQVVRDVYGERGAVARPGLIVGAHDPTGRLTYWPHRVARGGEVLAPGHADDPMQIIDVRDLAEFMVRIAESDRRGIFNVAGPRQPLLARSFYEQAAKALDANVKYTFVDDYDFLVAHKIEEAIPWALLKGNDYGMMSVRNDKAIAAGLTFRPLAVTAQETLEYHRSRPAERQAVLKAGLTAEREKEVLELWKASKR